MATVECISSQAVQPFLGIDDSRLGIVSKEQRQVQRDCIQACFTKCRARITREEVADTVLFIEKNLPDWREKKAWRFIKSKYSPCKRAIEYDPQQEAVYVHLGKQGTEIVGEGQQKIVTFSLRWQSNMLDLAARTCMGSVNEAKMLELLRGVQGVVETFALRKLKKKESYLFIQKFYNLGTLESCIREKKLERKQKEIVALSLLQTLGSLREKKVVHGDLHLRQCLVQKEQRTQQVAVVLCDFEKSFVGDEGECDQELEVFSELLRELFFKDDDERDWVYSQAAEEVLANVNKKLKNGELTKEKMSSDDALWYLLVKMAHARQERATAVILYDELKEIFSRKAVSIQDCV